jgi:hypothetical protein
MADGYEHIRIDQQGFLRLVWQELGENPCKNVTINLKIDRKMAL